MEFQIGELYEKHQKYNAHVCTTEKIAEKGCISC